MPATYEIVSGKSVGPFMLGDTLWHILDLIRTEKTRFPKVEIAWDTSKSPSSDLTLSLPNLTLYFPHLEQRLSLLKVTSISTSNLTLSLENQVLHSTNQQLTRGVIGRVLGPTYSGDGTSLVYPGIKFDITSQATGTAGKRDDRVESLTVITKDEGGSLPDITPLKSVSIRPNEGITIHIPHEVSVTIGETTGQDLLLDLGPPLRKYVKEDERMERIWGGDQPESSDSALRSTFWNYFQYGMDFLISPEGEVEKILLHSNIPGTPLFQRHARCPWTLPTSSGALTHGSPMSSFRAHFTGEPANQEHLQVPTPTTTAATGGAASSSGKKKNKNRNPSPSISDQSDTSEIKSSSRVPPTTGATSRPTSGPAEGDGMILDRVVEGGLDGVENLSPSRLVGFDGLILEEDQASGGITSVLVFKVDGTPL